MNAAPYLFRERIFGMWDRTVCLTYHFNNKLFVKRILTNEPSSHFYKSKIPFARKAIFRNSLLPQILIKLLNTVARFETSEHQIEPYSVKFKKK